MHSPVPVEFYLFGVVVNAAESPVAQTGGCPRALSIEISRFLVEQLEAVEIAIANDRSTSAASYRQTSPLRRDALYFLYKHCEPVSCLNTLISIRTTPVRYKASVLWKLRPPTWSVPPNASVNRPAVNLVLPTKAEAQNPWSHPVTIPHRYVKANAARTQALYTHHTSTAGTPRQR